MKVKRYSQNFKEEIVEQYNLGWTVSNLSKKYEVSEVSVYRWIKEFSNNKSNKSEWIHRNYNEIQQENVRLKQEVEILKKAVEIISKN